MKTIIQKLKPKFENEIYIKREDLIPYSFGGNKARKGNLFFQAIDEGDYDTVVTYGSSSSNHCRVVANMAASRNMPCYIISPEEASIPTFNSQLMELFHAHIIVCPVSEVHCTIENLLGQLKHGGKFPYFIPGGGHGNIGTQAYVNCYSEIKEYEKENQEHFDYIFHASGTGTTQAGLICGQLMNDDNRKIIGISIARKNPRGRQVVINSVKDYLVEKGISVSDKIIDQKTIFVDKFTGDGYGNKNEEIESAIHWVMVNYGIPLDPTYTGKGFWGMCKYLKEHEIKNKKVLFIHTGGTPLFFDYLKSEKQGE